MAEVTSSIEGELTVIVLNNVEAMALADLLETSDPDDNIELDELTNAMIGATYESR
jgi:hypothetical protein